MSYDRAPDQRVPGRTVGNGIPVPDEFRQRLRRLHRLCDQAGTSSIFDPKNTRGDTQRAQELVLVKAVELGLLPQSWKESPELILEPRQPQTNEELHFRSMIVYAGLLCRWATTHEGNDRVCAIFALRQAHAEEMVDVCCGVADPSPVTVWLDGEGYLYRPAQELSDPNRLPNQDPDDRYECTA